MAQRPKQHGRRLAPTQIYEENHKRTPMSHQRTRRTCTASVVTTSFGGKFVPLKAFGLLREDGAATSRFTINTQMAETASMLLNPVRITAMAYFIPKLALERFADMGTIDRSYNGQEEIDGSVVPWFVPDPQAGVGEFYRTLGLHAGGGPSPNDDYLQAYNTLWNYIAEHRSPSLSPRNLQDPTLAPAFWEHTQMKHVKPNFDDALMEGQVPLAIVDGGTIRTVPGQELTVPISKAKTTEDPDATFDAQLIQNSAGNSNRIDIKSSTSNDRLQHFFPAGSTEMKAGLDNIMSEMIGGNVTVSLANIDQARETAAWARMRTQYQGISEDWMIDQLMQGIRIQDEYLRHPIMLDHQSTVVGMSQRYATDSGNLEKSLTDGRGGLSLTVRVPQTTCGGVVMIVGQALPEQIYERQRDYYMMASTVDDLPNRQADELDPQPVVMVTKGEVDEAHTDSASLFGYAPLNHQWQQDAPNIGGRYYRPDPNEAWTEDRNRIWTPEVIDPELGPDFYLSTNLSHEVFNVSTEAPFEWWVNGALRVDGLTYFGPALRESRGDYDAVLASVDPTRLKGDGTDVPT